MLLSSINSCSFSHSLFDLKLTHPSHPTQSLSLSLSLSRPHRSTNQITRSHIQTVSFLRNLLAKHSIVICQNADRATVAGEPAFPHHQHLVRIAEVISRVVEEAMPQARTRDCADHHVRQERCEIGFRLPLSLEDGTDDVVSDEEREREEDTVVSDRERTDLEKNWVDIPDYRVRLRQYG